MKQGQIVKKFKSKSGKEFLIRNLRISDALGMRNLINGIIEENDYIRLNKKLSLKQEKEYLKKNLKDKLRVDLVAICQGKIVGHIQSTVNGGNDLHIGRLGIVINRDYREEGLGSFLMKEILFLSKRIFKLKIITLDVVSDNKRALNYYGKFGFKKFGILPKGTKIKGSYRDLIHLYKEF